MKLKKSLILLLALILILPLTVSASQQSGQYYPPSNSDYFQKKFSWQLYSSFGVKEIKFTQFDLDGKEKGKVNLKATENGFNWVDFSCKGNVSIEFLDENGGTVSFLTRGQARSYLDDTSCDYKSFVKTSNYDEKKKQYRDDTFGRNKKNQKKSTNKRN